MVGSTLERLPVHHREDILRLITIPTYIPILIKDSLLQTTKVQFYIEKKKSAQPLKEDHIGFPFCLTI